MLHSVFSRRSNFFHRLGFIPSIQSIFAAVQVFRVLLVLSFGMILNLDIYAEHSFMFFSSTVLVARLFVNSSTCSALQLDPG